MLFNINTVSGAQQIDVSQATLLADMKASGAGTVAKHIELIHGAPAANSGSIASQLAVQMGINPNMSLHDCLEGSRYIGPSGSQAATVGNDGSVTGRLVTEAVLFDAIENHLRDDLSGYPLMLSQNAALRRQITGTRWETPILDFKRPANARPEPVSQLSEPKRMLTLTTANKRNAILGESIGIEYSDQVAKDISIDVVALSLKRQATEAAAALAMYQIMSLLNGDVDYGMPALASVIPGGAVAASSLDSTAGGGKLTQAAWVKFLWRNNLRRTITTVITDLNGALAIENRQGRPTVMNDFGTSKRIDTMDNIVNPRWPDKVDVIITQDPSWPANTIVAFDKQFGYNYVTSASTDYSATEAHVIRRSTRMRFDTGSMVERFMADAWDILDFN